MARLLHPDMHPEDAASYTARFQEITEAYETLSDPYKKQVYDQQYRVYVLGERVYEEVSYYEEPEVTYHHYQPPVEPKRRKYVPYGAFVIMAFYFIRIISNSISASSVPEAHYRYEPLPSQSSGNYFENLKDSAYSMPDFNKDAVKRPF